ncbi:MAG: N-formylglutamate amidohydrolase [Alphaproteobacteria bacterium]|nr:N-formylglutamate amidohydrolase [Alphaproteobacteria bacterium]
MTEQTTHHPFELVAPARWLAPAVFASPHSGRHYSRAFLEQSRLSPQALRKSEDCYVDELFLSCLDFGAPMLRANVPRAFIDLNREPYELDRRMFADDLPGYVNSTSARVAGGLGTIPRVVAEGEEIYRGLLRFADAVERINTVYLPYHRTLAALFYEVMRKNGAALLIDCHSMPASALAHVQHAKSGPIDVVIGDRFGAACNEDLTSYLEEIFRAEGLRVLRNKPYAGGFITQSHGAPASGRHALQIEVNRALYLSEPSLEKSAGFLPLRKAIAGVLGKFLPVLETWFSPQRQAAE